MPSETMDYSDSFFDYAFVLNILHHVDIPRTLADIKRVMKAGGWLIGCELYTHSFVQKYIRQNWLVRKAIYPRMQSYIYDGPDPYITQYERKINEVELRKIFDICTELKISYYDSFTGRLLPDKIITLAQIDRRLTKLIRKLGKFTAGRVVFEGRLVP